MSLWFVQKQLDVDCVTEPLEMIGIIEPSHTELSAADNKESTQIGAFELLVLYNEPDLRGQMMNKILFVYTGHLYLFCIPNLFKSHKTS